MEEEIIERRAEPRKLVRLHAFVSDLEEKIEVKCMIRDVSKNGCKLVARELLDLPNNIRITPEGFEEPIRGKIIWRQEKIVGVRFIKESEQKRARNIESYMAGLETQKEYDDIIILDDEEKAPPKPLSFWARMKNFASVGRVVRRAVAAAQNWNLLFTR